MTPDDDNRFDFLAADMAISVEYDGVDYVFSSHVLGRLKQWLVITQDSALEGFHDQIKPGCRLEIGFLRQGAYYRMEAFVKRMVSGGAKAVVIDRPGKIEAVERRRHPRRDCHFGAVMEIHRRTRVTITNINIKGCRLRMSHEKGQPPMLREQERVFLEIRLPGERRTVPMRGEIRNLTWNQDNVEAGILFEGASRGLTEILALLDDRGFKQGDGSAL